MTANTQKPRILLVEDEPHLAFNVQLNLKSEGYDVDIAASGKAALEAFKNESTYGLILLDVMIPEPDGFTVAREIRAKDPNIAIFMLTARAAEMDRIRGLEHGVDDYICKPFHLKELLLKVRRALARNTLGKPGVNDVERVDLKLHCGPFTLDPENLELRSPEGVQKLTVLEADMLSEFMINPGRVLSREHLLAKVWGVSKNLETRTIDNFVMRIRRYIEKDPANPTYLQSVRGRGYRFHAESTETEQPIS